MRLNMLKLYYSPGSCALASHITLEETGAAYAAERVDFKSNQQISPTYLAINPKGRVPALVTDQGILTETPAILAFIAQSFPKAKLALFEDSFAFAKVQSFNSYLCSTVHVAHAHRGRGYRWANEESSFADMKRKVPETMAACFALIERDMLRGPWVMGETYTICDPYLFTLSGWLEGDGVNLSALPKVMDHRKRMSERPAVRKVLADESNS
jgi:glutathione S-transferase